MSRVPLELHATGVPPISFSECSFSEVIVENVKRKKKIKKERNLKKKSSCLRIFRLLSKTYLFLGDIVAFTSM